jgi:hypothetical protein
VFECSRAQELPLTQVERTFRTEWLVYDVNGTSTAQQPIADAQTVFTIAPATRGFAGLDAEITVHRQRSAPLENAKVAATQTPKKASFDLEKPFIIERHGKTWCFAGRKPCPSQDKNERTFLTALGASVELLSPEPSIAAARGGKPSDGSLNIPLPRSLLNRIELSTTRALAARQHGAGFPAHFSYETHNDEAVLANLVKPGKPGTRTGDLTIDVAIDRDCRLSGFSVTQDVALHLTPGAPSALRFHHTRTFSLHRTGPGVFRAEFISPEAGQ